VLEARGPAKDGLAHKEHGWCPDGHLSH